MALPEAEGDIHQDLKVEKLACGMHQEPNKKTHRLNCTMYV
jgi:hypothetical protein